MKPSSFFEWHKPGPKYVIEYVNYKTGDGAIRPLNQVNLMHVKKPLQKVTTKRFKKTDDRLQRRKTRLCVNVMHGGMLKRQDLKFLTLTSSPSRGYEFLRRDWEILKKRLKRYLIWKLKTEIDFQYVAVKTKEGNGVLHIVTTMPFIPQFCLMSQWTEIHKAYELRIKTLWKKGKGKLQYYLTKYLKNQGRLSYSRKWVPTGYSKHLKETKRNTLFRMEKPIFKHRTEYDKYNIHHFCKYGHYVLSYYYTCILEDKIIKEFIMKWQL